MDGRGTRYGHGKSLASNDMEKGSLLTLLSSPTLRFTRRDFAQLFSEADIKAFTKAGLLEDSGIIQTPFCDECSAPHDVTIDLSTTPPSYICPSLGTVILCDRDAIDCVRFSLLTFFSTFAKKMGMVADVAFLNGESGALRIGTMRRNGVLYTVFFSTQPTASIESSARTTPENSKVIILTLQQENLNIPVELAKRTRSVELTGYVGVERATLKYDKDAWECDIDGLFRIVRGTNGKLIINGKTYREYEPSQAQYHYIHFLDQHFDVAQPQHLIFAYCQQEMSRLKHDFSYSADTFCATIQSKILNEDKESKGLVGQVLKSTNANKRNRTKALYKLTNLGQE